MKRPRGLWLLLSAGVLWLTIQDVYCIKATSLIFGKTSTSTTDNPSSSPSGEENASEATTTTEASSTSNTNVTKSPLTGIPQIDYIWDPNLPRELNGYNLSEYPFYDRVPEDIKFKCDGLHDGFYASVPHKCQVYHHCLFGTRYDFLCANYTAFDQKTFICHFVSEVDCVNSKKFWHRNDALYQAATTTTLKPLTVHTTTTPPPPQAEASPSAPGNPRRPLAGNGGRRQRPFRRRRPQYDYYEYEDYEPVKDDYYDEPLRRKRPRPRPRPVVYDDEYDDYPDDRYERRGLGRRDNDRNRRPYDRRGTDDRRYDDRRPMDRKRNKNERRKYDGMDEDRYEDDMYMRRKRPNKERDYEDRRPADKRPVDDRRYEKRRPAAEDDDYDRRGGSRKGHRRPPEDDYEDDKHDSSKRSEDRKRPEESKTMIKPTSGSSIYDRPRAAPRIRPPVPKSEQEKYAYKPISLKTPPKEEEYYDDYEEEPLPKKVAPRPSKKSEEPRRPVSRDEEDRLPVASVTRQRGHPAKKTDYVYDDDEKAESHYHPPKRNKYGGDNLRDKQPEVTTTTTTTTTPTTTTKKPLPPEDYYYDDDYEDYGKPIKSEEQPSTKITKEHESRGEKDIHRSETTTTTTTTTPATTTKAPKASFKERPDPIIRVVKRPFLPSRGGNPYAARGLQPVGIKAIDIKRNPSPMPYMDRDAPYKSEIRSQKIGSHDGELKVSPELRENQHRNSEKHEDHTPRSTTTTTTEQAKVEYKDNYYHHNRQPAAPVEETYDDKAEEKPYFKPSPVLVKVPFRPKFNVPTGEAAEEHFRHVSNRPAPSLKQNAQNAEKAPQTTQKPKLSEKNPLDINENEYDVTLNDALNPTLPNLPIRGFPTGFSSSNHFTYNSFQRPRYQDTGLTQAGSDFAYQVKIPQQRYEAQLRNSGGPQQFVNTNVDYTGQYSSLIGQTNQNYQNNPRVAQSHSYYSPY